MSASEPLRILVVANETLGGRALVDAVRKRAEETLSEGRPHELMVICPQNQPKHGYVLYDDSIRSAAESRLETTLAQLKQAGVMAVGEIMDPDAHTAVMDAVDHFEPDEIIISTHPATRSGWLRRDLIDRIRQATGLPVTHVVVDLDADREDSTHVLVVANQTVEGEPLLRRLRELAAEEPHRFTVIMPQAGYGDDSAGERLASVLERLEELGLEAAGQVTHPDPFTSIQNALQFYAIDSIVISTFPDKRSGWLRGDLVGRVERSTSKPVEHVVVTQAESREGAVS